MVDSKRIIVKDSVPFPFIILAPAPLSVYTRNMCIVYTCIPALYVQ